MDKVHIMDLQFQEASHTIATFVVERSEGPVPIKPMPESTCDQLTKGLSIINYAPEDIKHVLLTHIYSFNTLYFNLAGAARKFAKLGATIYAHPNGAPHLYKPEKLWQSVKKYLGTRWILFAVRCSLLLKRILKRSVMEMSCL